MTAHTVTHEEVMDIADYVWMFLTTFAVIIGVVVVMIFIVSKVIDLLTERFGYAWGLAFSVFVVIALSWLF